MLTNTQSAQVIEELVKGAVDSGEPVTITPVDEDALRAGAKALRTMDVSDNLPFVNETVRLALEQRDAARREVKRLREALRSINRIDENGNAVLKGWSEIDDIVRAALNGADTPDPRAALADTPPPDAKDEALERAEAKAWSVVMFLDGVHRHKLIENYSPDYAGLQDARTDAADLLAAIRAARGSR